MFWITRLPRGGHHCNDQAQKEAEQRDEGGTVNVRNPNVRLSDNAEIRTIDRSVRISDVRAVRFIFLRSNVSLDRFIYKGGHKQDFLLYKTVYASQIIRNPNVQLYSVRISDVIKRLKSEQICSDFGIKYNRTDFTTEQNWAVWNPNCSDFGRLLYVYIKRSRLAFGLRHSVFDTVLVPYVQKNLNALA